MDVLFSSLFGGTTLIFDKKFSLLKETLASPISRFNIILGIGLSGVTKAFIQTVHYNCIWKIYRNGFL